MQSTLLPVILSLANLALTLGVFVFLWWNRGRILGANGNGHDAVTPRQYERLVHRFDTFEQEQHRRAQEDTDFRRNVLGANDSQLTAMQRQNTLLETVLRGQQFLKGKVLSLPCVERNGVTDKTVTDKTVTEKCPPEEKKGKTK